MVNVIDWTLVWIFWGILAVVWIIVVLAEKIK